MKTIAQFGLGKLGAVLGAVLAERGFRVIGVDVNPAVVNCVNAGRPHIQEPGYPELLARVKGRFTATTSATNAVLHAAASIILVPTPSEPDGAFSNEYVLEACRAIREVLALKPQDHLVIIASTVMPGSCAGPIRDALGPDVGLVYSPEFVALGDVIAGFKKPDFLLLGYEREQDLEGALGIYERLYEAMPPVAAASLINAEIAKIALNAYITTKMTFANEIGRLCEAIPGGNADDVLGAIGLDGRIGRKYLRAGPAYGGPCFPRDNRALFRAGTVAGVGLPLPALVDKLNGIIAYTLALRIRKMGGSVGILGLTYKCRTPVTEEAFGLQLARHLQDDTALLCYDPLAQPGDVPLGTLAEVAAQDIVVITLPYPEWRELPFRPGQTVIDCWRLLDGAQVRAAGATYIAVGVHS